MTNVQNTAHDLEAAGADPKLAAAIARAIRTADQPAGQPPRWPVPVIAAVLIATIGIVGAGVYRNGDRIDTISDRLSSLEVSMSERLSSLEVSMSERLARMETLIEERLPERR